MSGHDSFIRCLERDLLLYKKKHSDFSTVKFTFLSYLPQTISGVVCRSTNIWKSTANVNLLAFAPSCSSQSGIDGCVDVQTASYANTALLANCLAKSLGPHLVKQAKHLFT